jgi:hypothetical protein
VDDKLSTRWETGVSQAPGMWVMIELPAPTLIDAIELDSTPSADDYPRGYKVEASLDGTTWGQPVASGKGRKAFTEIKFDPVTAKFLRITQTGAVDGLFWSIHELNLYQPSLKTTIISKPLTRPANVYE